MRITMRLAPASLLLAGSLLISPALAGESSGSYMIDRAAGVSGTPVQSVPDMSLRSEYRREATVENISPGSAVRSRSRGAGAVVIGGGASHLPQSYNRTRRYHSYPSVVYEPSPVVTNQTTTVQPRTEYDTYGIGNTVKVDRVYTTTERETVVPPVIYQVHPDKRVSHRKDPLHGRYRPATTVVQDGYRIKETETSMETIRAERASVPGQNYVRMIGSDGKVYLVPSERLRQEAQAGGEAGIGWTPRTLNGN